MEAQGCLRLGLSRPAVGVHLCRLGRTHQVVGAEFRGGTLDNPNLVDKKAAFLVMRALLALSRHDENARGDGAAGIRKPAHLPGHCLSPSGLPAGAVAGTEDNREIGFGHMYTAPEPFSADHL